MQIRIKEDSVEITGYVNAIERKSKRLTDRVGEFVERIKKGAFKRAIERNNDIRILLNHSWERDLGGTGDGNLELTEDNIGLRARATITDKEVVKEARDGRLVGWSFGFRDRDVDKRVDEDGITLRDVKDLDLLEVSILDDTRTPAYDGTLIMARANNDMFFGEDFIDEIETRAEREEIEQPEVEAIEIDYSEYEKMIAEMKGAQE